MTKMYRKTTCNGCGFSHETSTTYYLDAKAWKTSHTLSVHNKLWEHKNDLAREEEIDYLLSGRAT